MSDDDEQCACGKKSIEHKEACVLNIDSQCSKTFYTVLDLMS